MLSPLPSACLHLLPLIVLHSFLVFLVSLSSTPLIELIDNVIFLLEQLVNPLFNFLFSPSFFKVDQISWEFTFAALFFKVVVLFGQERLRFAFVFLQLVDLTELAFKLLVDVF